ncbi:MAG: OmpA family protein [Paracoccaceae bacterium]
MAFPRGLFLAVWVVFLSCLGATGAWADATVPTGDIAGSQDSALVGRLAGSFIVDYEVREFDEVAFPLAKLIEVPGGRDAKNNRVFEPETVQAVEGPRTRIVYVTLDEASPLQVIRGYQQELEARGGVEAFACKGFDCGGSATRSGGGGGGEMSLAMYLWPPENLKGDNFSNANCVQLGTIADQRYALMHLAEARAWVSIHTYAFQGGTYCNALKGRTVAVIDIVTEEGLKAEFETVRADKMAAEISSTGKIALYGIQFDTDKAVLRDESTATVAEIAALLKGTVGLRLLIVGHTDSVGSYDYNLDLSQRRAAAVVEALVTAHGIDRARLYPVGVSFASPVDTNTTEEGRAKNRRVELVSF